MRRQRTWRPAASATVAITSAPTPHVTLSSWTTITLPVRLDDSQTASRSQGEIERRSKKSTPTSTSLRKETTRWQSLTVEPQVTIVRSSPWLSLRDFPRGTRCRSTSADVIVLRSFKHDFGYKKIVGRSD